MGDEPMRLSKLMALAGAALTALAFGTAAQAQTPKTFELRFNHVHSPREVFPHKGLTAWAKAVDERTKGAVKITVFHSAQLGVEEDIIEQIRQGANVGQNTDAARLGNYVPEIAVLNGPYFAETVEDVIKLRSSPTIKKAVEDLASKSGIRVVSFNWLQGYRHFFTNKPIKSPADLAGLRIRTPPAPIWQESVRALGATPIALPFGEQYPALQQKAIDGVELVYNNIPAGRFYEVLKYVSPTRHILLMNFEVISEKWFKTLPEEFQKILLEEADKAGEAASNENLETSLKVVDDLKSKGMIIVPESEIDMAAFRKAGDKAYEALKLTAVKEAVLKEIGKK
jgi:TRAP-type transport system periplasmic protein